MGQIFSACAYDIQTKTCCVMDADKFHANCYSYNGTVFSMHCLLRQKPWRMMWGGNYVCGDLEKYSRDEDLHGLSTYLSKEYFERNEDNEEYHNKAKLIVEYRKQWKRIDVLDEAIQYFDWKTTKSVKYEGYLLNHTQKTAIDLADFYRQSVSFADDNSKMVIDLVPVLCETGEGTPMALYEGISTDTTEELAGTWCGDELQIVDDLPEDYRLINCCFAEIWRRANFCHDAFGVNQVGYLLKDDSQNLYEATRLNMVGQRGKTCIIKVEKTERGIKYIPEPLPETKTNEEDDDEEDEQDTPLAIAKSMLKMGLSVDDVIKMTGVSKEQLKIQ